MNSDLQRCSWPGSDPLYVTYHEEEWGVPVHDDPTHFEYIILDGAQAGLSWITILRRREGYRKAFANWDVEAVARYTDDDCQRLLQDPGIIRNRLKVYGAVQSAQAFLRVQEEFGSFDRYIWGFVNHETIHSTDDARRVTSPESDAMAKDMKKRGFKFCGSTICYAYMQAAGLVNDHALNCFRHEQLRNYSSQPLSESN